MPRTGRRRGAEAARGSGQARHGLVKGERALIAKNQGRPGPARPVYAASGSGYAGIAPQRKASTAPVSGQ